MKKVFNRIEDDCNEKKYRRICKQNSGKIGWVTKNSVFAKQADGSRKLIEIHNNNKLLICGGNLSELVANDTNVKCSVPYKTMFT